MFLPKNASAAACASACGWTGTGPSAQCVAYAKGGDCSDASGTCQCITTIGCNQVGAACQSAGSVISAQPSFCCTGGGGGGGGGAVCGNGTCDSGESTASCASDCPGGGGGGGGGGWGACGSCTGCQGPQQYCMTDPMGSCIANPGVCQGPPPPAAFYNIWSALGVDQSYPSITTVAANTPFYSVLEPVNQGISRVLFKIVSGDANYFATTGYTATARNAVSASYNHPTRGTQWWAALLKGNSPGVVIIDADIFTNVGYEIFLGTKRTVITITGAQAVTNDLKVNGSDGPISVASGSSITITWNVSGVNTCTASVTGPALAGWAGAKSAASGPHTQTIAGYNTSRNINLNCVNTTTYESVNDTVSVNVGAAVPYCTIRAATSPTTVEVNRTATFTPIINTFNGGTVASVNYTSVTPANFIVLPVVPKVVSPFTVTVQGVRPSWTRMNMTATLATGQTCTSSVGVRAIVWLCNNPIPHDPPLTQCPSTPVASDGAITWEWEPVGNATHYRLQVRSGNSLTGPIVYDSNAVLGTTLFGPTCDPTIPNGVCRYTSNNLRATNYFSLIQASSLNQCSASGWAVKEVDLAACAVDAWWQAGNGNVISNSNITSIIPSLTETLIKDGAGGKPGVALHGSGSVNSGSGQVSSTRWDARTTYSAPIPDYQSFYSLVPSGTSFVDPGANPNFGTFNSGGAADANGYVWYRHTGDMTINNPGNTPFSAGRKVIVFVDGGDVTINGPIQFANRANSFFMLIVGPNSGGARGGIRIAPAVTSAVGTPTLEGIFNARTVATGAGSGPLSFRGSVAATNGITLERDLGAANLTTPGETFTMSPELLWNYPPALTFKRVSWQEVAP